MWACEVCLPKRYFTLLQCFLFNISYPGKRFSINIRHFVPDSINNTGEITFWERRKRPWSGSGMLTWIPWVAHIKSIKLGGKKTKSSEWQTLWLRSETANIAGCVLLCSDRTAKMTTVSQMSLCGNGQLLRETSAGNADISFEVMVVGVAVFPIN